MNDDASVPPPARQAGEGEAHPSRPITITAICVLGFLGSLVAVPLIFSDAGQSIGNWYPPWLGFSAVIGFICMLGLWKMRRWAVFTYAGFAVIGQVVLIAMGVWNISAFLIPGLVITLAFMHLRKMR